MKDQILSEGWFKPKGFCWTLDTFHLWSQFSFHSVFCAVFFQLVCASPHHFSCHCGGCPSQSRKLKFSVTVCIFQLGKQGMPNIGRESFLKTRNSADWNRERRFSQFSWQQPLHSYRIHPRKPSVPGWAVKHSSLLCSSGNGSHLSCPSEQGSLSAALLIQVPSCVSFSTSWHSFAVQVVFSSSLSRIILWVRSSGEKQFYGHLLRRQHWLGKDWQKCH